MKWPSVDCIPPREVSRVLRQPYFPSTFSHLLSSPLPSHLASLVEFQVFVQVNDARWSEEVSHPVGGPHSESEG